MWEQRTIIYNQNNLTATSGGIIGAMIVGIVCIFIFLLSLKIILQELGVWDVFLTIGQGISIGFSAYARPWNAYSFNAFFGWYFVGFTILFLLILALWVLILPLRFFDITVPFKPIFITALIFSIIPLTIWICCGLGYWYWFMPPA
jgi:hypothetical protein